MKKQELINKLFGANYTEQNLTEQMKKRLNREALLGYTEPSLEQEYLYKKYKISNTSQGFVLGEFAGRLAQPLFNLYKNYKDMKIDKIIETLLETIKKGNLPHDQTYKNYEFFKSYLNSLELTANDYQKAIDAIADALGI